MVAALHARDFSEFYRVEFARVVRSVRSVAGAAAEDVAQEAFIVAHARWDEVAGMDVPFAWVRRVAWRVAGRRAARDRMRNELEAAATMGELTRGPDLALVAAVADLPNREATAVWLHHLGDRPVVEVADRLGCSVGATKLLLLRSRRHLAERLGGLSGRWVSERSWTPDSIVDHLLNHAAGEHVGAVLDDDLGGRGGRWELTIADGSYTLNRDDGMRLDSGSCKLRGPVLELIPARVPGHILLHSAIDGDRLMLQLVETTSGPTRGVPDALWVGLFWESGPFGYLGRARPRT